MLDIKRARTMVPMDQGADGPGQRQGTMVPMDQGRDKRCSTCKKWKDCNSFSDRVRRENRAPRRWLQLSSTKLIACRCHFHCIITSFNLVHGQAENSWLKTVIELRARVVELESTIAEQAQTIKLLQSGEHRVGLVNPSSVTHTTRHGPDTATSRPISTSQSKLSHSYFQTNQQASLTTPSAFSVPVPVNLAKHHVNTEICGIDLDLFGTEGLLCSGSGSASDQVCGSGAGSGQLQRDDCGMAFHDLQLRVRQNAANAWHGKSLPSVWESIAYGAFPEELEETYQTWRGDSANLSCLFGSIILLFHGSNMMLILFSATCFGPYTIVMDHTTSLVTSFLPAEYFESMSIFTGMADFGNTMYPRKENILLPLAFSVLASVVAWTFQGKAWFGVKHMLTWRSFWKVCIIWFSIANPVSYFQQHLAPTPNDLTMYATVTCIRVVCAKIGLDTPAWLHVSTVLLQVAAAACIPAFQDPLITASPAIMLILTAFICFIYGLEFMRRRDFLQALGTGC